jgi:hypothetical protein
MMETKKAAGSFVFIYTLILTVLMIFFMVGVMVYLGILNPAKFLPNTCFFGQPMLCRQGGIFVNQRGTIQMTVVNNLGRSIKVQSATLTTNFTKGCSVSPYICFDNVPPGGDGKCIPGLDQRFDIQSGLNQTWEDDASKKIIADCGAWALNLPPGEKVKFTLTMEWYPAASDSTYAKPITGQLYAEVQ